MSNDHTHTPLDAVSDSAPGFGLEGVEIRFAAEALGLHDTGATHHRLAPGARPDFAHRHVDAEELYVVSAGSGRMKLDETVLELVAGDAIRVAPRIWRAFEGGPDGLEIIAFGARFPDDGETMTGFWP